MSLIVFVCRGNTCRSPMAEACARHEAAARGIGKLQFSSAGIAVDPVGGARSTLATEVLAERGIRPGPHCAQPLSEDLFESAALVLTLDESVRDHLLARWPRARGGKVRMLLSYAPERGTNVTDPWGGTIEDYRAAFDRIRAGVDGFLGSYRANGY